MRERTATLVASLGRTIFYQCLTLARCGQTFTDGIHCCENGTFEQGVHDLETVGYRESLKEMMKFQHQIKLIISHYSF